MTSYFAGRSRRRQAVSGNASARAIIGLRASAPKMKVTSPAGVPLIQLPGLHEVGVAAQQDRLEPGPAAQRDGLVQILIGPLVAGTVARAVHQIQRLLGVGQRDQQRVVAPLPVVADVHPLLALAEGGGDGAVGIEDRLLEELRLLLLPDLQAGLVDRLHQRQDLLLRSRTAGRSPRRWWDRECAARPGHPDRPRRCGAVPGPPGRCRRPACCRRCSARGRSRDTADAP